MGSNPMYIFHPLLTPYPQHFKCIYMRLLDVCICVQNTHRYAHKTRIHMGVFYAYILYASKRHIYMRLKCLVKNNSFD